MTLEEPRILLVGDIHLSDRPPTSCTESYLDDLFDMLRHVAKLEKAWKADAVVWAGDIFHHKQPSRTSHATILRTIEVIKEYNNLYIVTGNHDIRNDIVDTVHETQPLGILFQSGAKELVGWHEYLPLFGVPWQQRWLNEDTPWEAFEEWRAKPDFFPNGQTQRRDLSKSLVVTHAPIYPPYEAQSVLFELVPTSGAHGLGEAMGHEGYLYYGHIHEDHGIWEDDGVTYANMGALSRGSLTEYNRERKIKVCAWTPSEGFKEVPIPHKPASEVFKLTEAEEKKTEKLSLDTFLSEVGSTQLSVTSIENVIGFLASRQDLDPKIRQVAKQLLEAQL